MNGWIDEWVNQNRWWISMTEPVSSTSVPEGNCVSEVTGRLWL